MCICVFPKTKPIELAGKGTHRTEGKYGKGGRSNITRGTPVKNGGHYNLTSANQPSTTYGLKCSNMIEHMKSNASQNCIKHVMLLYTSPLQSYGYSAGNIRTILSEAKLTENLFVPQQNWLRSGILSSKVFKSLLIENQNLRKVRLTLPDFIVIKLSL
eukprot:GHVL01030659.1.p1 GENE.GHVL01030659.1~~GHVL01030659.1.p1  ORF type:complete len:158 (+),score=3.12 GHVL01030659.1:201-674(+)